MGTFFESMGTFFNNIVSSIGVTDILDIAIVAFLVYKVLGFIRETRAEQLAKGLLVLVVVTLLSDIFHLYTLHWILSNLMTVGLLALVVLFQPELRRALEKLGRSKFINIAGDVNKEEAKKIVTGKEREDAITKEKGAVFIMKIGGKLASGEKHDGRSPDYDDWELNGDIILWNEILDRSFEISSMGIRVDADAMMRQLKEAGCEDRAELTYQKAVLEDRLPYTIGGGIGQSRLCMFFLRKAHIGEVQASVWPDEMIEICEQNNIHLL